MTTASASPFRASAAALAGILTLLAGCRSEHVPGARQKRVILFLGDGLGVPVLTAARIYAHGETGTTAIDALPEAAFVRTYSLGSQVTDCAAAMTAVMTGVKSPDGAIGMIPDTSAGAGTPMPTLFEMAKARGWATGIVTSKRVTDATPAAAYAHVGDSGRQDDIAAQLVDGAATRPGTKAPGVDVILGGGRSRFLPTGLGAGLRTDGRDLLAELQRAGYRDLGSDGRTGIGRLGNGPGPAVGLFAGGDMSYTADRDPAHEPSLGEMSLAAFEALARGDRNFFLLVEGGRIDDALHDTNARRALADATAFDEALRQVMARARLDDPTLARTLVVFAADHDHTMVMNGYAQRTGPTNAKHAGILGPVRNVFTGAPDHDGEGVPYPILVFGNGPNRVAGSRAAQPELDEGAMAALDYRQEAVIRMPPGGETHGGSDVAIGAAGLGASAVRGYMDNTGVFRVLQAAVTGEPAGDPPPAFPDRARNVIFFLGDGMGITPITVARIFNRGVAGRFTFETLPFSARIKTYSADGQTTDSAPSMSAYTTGIKSNNDVIAMTTDTIGDKSRCTPDNGKAKTTILEMAKARGLAVGAVTTTEATHATPAATYAHICHRELPFDIAVQAIPGGRGFNPALGDGLDVLLGGGRNHFTPFEMAGNPKGRKDGRDLVGELRALGYATVSDRTALLALPAGTRRVVGLFTAENHMTYQLDRDPAVEPSLAEMTGKALDILDRPDGKGYFLMVEGGRIDHTLHETNVRRMVEEVRGFDDALALALSRVDLSETLVIVTADHDHTLTFNGYPGTANPVLGVVRDRVTGEVTLDADGLPYPTLVFGNGERRLETRSAADMAGAEGADFHQLAGVARKPGMETHGGADVMLTATGPGSHRFHGVMDNTDVFGIMKDALGF